MKECQQCKRCYADEVTACPDDGQPTFHTISGEPVLEGKYKLERRLGQGGMGVVYCARHAYLKTQHAVKVILPDLVGNDPQLVTRFRQEALAAAAIRHGNVIAVTDFGVVQGTMPFLVMEYVEGESLHDLLAREKRLSPERAAELMSAIAGGVGAAHRQGIVHRDLKPLNIMICKDKSSMADAVKILDFGLAKIKSGELLGSFIQAQTTGLMGSPYYMAPEQWADEEPDAQADIYSLGVMLFQMLAGDVPFKGSSIPAIMKKHLSDPPPSFAEFGVQIAPQVELAVRHSLEKDRSRRTQTVEQMVEELRSAVGYSSQSIHATGRQTTGTALPVSSIHILSSPPQSNVFVDNVAVGQTQPNGWLLLEGLQSGNHRLRVSREGFQDWENDIFCDGRPQQVVAELKNAAQQTSPPVTNQQSAPNLFNQTNPAATNVFNPSQSLNTGGAAQQTHGFAQQTAPPHHQPAAQNTVAQSQPPQSNFIQSEAQPKAKKGLFSPLLLAIIGISGLLLLTAIGAISAYRLGLLGRSNAVTGNVNNAASPTPNATSTPPVEAIRAEMVKIDGGKFKMGRNDGELLERPEHEVEVKDFWMDKTEVTNAEYYEFVKATGYSPLPSDWEKGKPLENEAMLPVRYVNLDDVAAFAKWRSERDNVQYRLPTEEEWEYAARNGSENNLYPWGDVWEDSRAAINRDLVFAAVGSKPNGVNKWGVADLIGNVWEWTSTKASAYPAADSNVSKQIESRFGATHAVVRGTFSLTKETSTANSTVRAFAAAKNRDKVIGFRLVRSE
ncbi:MAG: SUMF1/EgtB/PvdO family nonheme iron enzyme [Acidobacteriota bacterium]|nr:SUMF1/EgtB/PvdO family nonheme iron enzyme [Acidobacteriota bacterium]